ncbi:hypothetical protein Tco_1334790 [Tanacetum coccineum]
MMDVDGSDGGAGCGGGSGAATTASILEVEQDSGNITKTRSKATLNEPSSPGTSSGSGPRVESSDDEASLGEDASKQGRINAIDADEDITLVSVHDMNVSADEEVGEEDVVEVITTAKLIIDAAQVSVAGDKVCTAGAATTVSATATTVDDLTLAQALQEMKSTKPKLKRVVIQEPGLSIGTLDAATICADSESISSSKEILCIQTGSSYSKLLNKL